MKTSQYLVMGGLLLSVALIAASCATSCNRTYGVIVSETRPLRGFESIEIFGSPTVVYTQADTFGIRVEGPEKLVNGILTEVNDGTLSVRNKGKLGFVNVTVGRKSDVTVYVSSPDLVRVSVNGSGDFICHEKVDTDKMRISLYGSGDIDFSSIICDECEIELVGSGDVSVKRLEALYSSASLTGSGDIELGESRVKDTDLTLKGSGDISVHFSDDCQSAKCYLEGSGDIELSGSLSHFDFRKSGSGEVETEQLRIRE